MKKLILLLLLSSSAFCQKQGNIWYFGNQAGVDFNSGSPVVLLNSQQAFYGHSEGTAAISDSSGALLFYTDGQTIWNKSHQVMMNGTGLLGNYSACQSSIIVPDPSKPDRYFYVFTVSSGFCCNGSVSDGIRYSVVDMCLDSQKGAVITSKKNILLEDSVAEKVAVTRHANGNDYWVLTHKFFSDKFYAFQLSSTGITNTVVTAIGSVHGPNIATSMGQLKISPNRQKIAIGCGNGGNLLELFDFNPQTGVVSNSMALTKANNNHCDAYGVEFSPDNSKLYSQGLTNAGMLQPILCQFDLSSGILATINASRVDLFAATSGELSPKGLQLGPDGKIYQVSLNPSPATSGSLDVIANPNLAGAACGHSMQVISLNGKKGSYSLPSFIAAYSYSNKMTNCDSVSHVGLLEWSGISGFNAYPIPADDQLHVRLNRNVGTDYEIRITDLHGSLKYRNDQLTDTTFDIGLSSFSEGMYYLELHENGQTTRRQKLLIAH